MSVCSTVLIAFGLACAVIGSAEAGRFEAIVVRGVITQSPSSGNSTTIDTKGVFSPAGTDWRVRKSKSWSNMNPSISRPREATATAPSSTV